MTDDNDNDKPDLSAGIPYADLADGAMLAGKVGDSDILVARRGNELFAIDALCTHYHGPLAEGLMVGDTVRCPWHHACFSLRTGEALRAPALDGLACWKVERNGDKIYVRDKLPAGAPRAPSAQHPQSIVIVGGGAAGIAAAEMLRRDGYHGVLTMISADADAPYDRPNLSKDYLAGDAPEEWMPLRSPDWYAEQRIDLMLDTRVDSIDSRARTLQLDDGKRLGFGTLLLATGAEPTRPDVPGADAANVVTLRSFADARALIAKCANAKRIALLGAGFIGLEVAAALTARKIEVHVIAPDKLPLERVVGSEIARVIRQAHEAKGVTFHLECKVTKAEGKRLTLSDGSTLDADFVVAGVGVKPRVELAERAGLALDRGILVDAYLQTSVPGIFAAGDVARWPDPHSGERLRIEHWVVAERQGQVAAKNMLGGRVPFDHVPFFWTHQYELTVDYVGHAEKWDAIEIDGSPDQRNCRVIYKKDGRVLAVATIDRDVESLKAEVGLEGSRA